MMNVEVVLKKKGLEIDQVTFQKMGFLFNALDNGWSIKKRDNAYIFTKNHEGKKEVFDDSYLTTFMAENADLTNLLSS